MKSKPFVLAAKAMIRDRRGRYLFIRRSGECRNFTGKWEIPGGKADPGETASESLLREVAEETGLRITISGVMGAAESEIAKYRLAYIIFEAAAKGSRVRLSSEHDEYVWATIAGARRLDLCPAFKRFIGGIQHRRTSHE